jgi:hypothetical protein
LCYFSSLSFCLIEASYNGAAWVLDDTTINGWFFKLDNRGVSNPIANGMWLYRIPSGAGQHVDEAPVFGVTNGNAFFAQPVGIGTVAGTAPDAQLQVVGNGHFTGNLVVDGNIAAKYQDIAEWVSTGESLAAGTVVFVDAAGHNAVSSSTRAYQTSVAGVVSGQRGLILGIPGDSKAKIATTGRVKVRVDATRGAIAPGDLLVTSDETGTAMRFRGRRCRGYQDSSAGHDSRQGARAARRRQRGDPRAAVPSVMRPGDTHRYHEEPIGQ